MLHYGEYRKKNLIDRVHCVSYASLQLCLTMHFGAHISQSPRSLHARHTSPLLTAHLGNILRQDQTNQPPISLSLCVMKTSDSFSFHTLL